MIIFKTIKMKCFLSSSHTRRTLTCIYSCLQIPPRENWFQYVRRVYATAINFPCINTLIVIFWTNIEIQRIKIVTIFKFHIIKYMKSWKNIENLCYYYYYIILANCVFLRIYEMINIKKQKYKFFLITSILK